ncbi:MAG: methyl-accepting chemotaxis protein [Granulosicoccus sp.]|nr:methyl-accepting chemotaxis protein [Granulosicoccus sp.]
MPLVTSTPREQGSGVPFLLVMLSVLALLVSLLGLTRTVTVANDRLADLQLAWQAVQNDTVEGSELVATNRQMERMQTPLPALQKAAYWSLGLVILSIVLCAWLLISMRRTKQSQSQVDDERHKAEQSDLMKLTDEIAPLANGDLRVRATVTDSTAGSVANVFNYAVSELHWLVGTMGHVAAKISQAVDRSRHSADSIAVACTEQSSEIHRSSNDLLTMSGKMAELSADAADASVAAQAAADQAERGADALSAGLNRLFTIRDEADETTRLMHRLVENVSAIDERVTTIQKVARRTDLLALNTTIRASAGSRAASVTDAAADLGHLSDEVAQLAEVLGQATRDIGTLTSTISQDASDTVQSMEHTNAELAAGVAQTRQASQALELIRMDTQALRERVFAMADKTVQQTGILRQLSESMDLINSITRKTGEGVSANAASLDELLDLASELQRGLADFQLPDKPDAEVTADDAPKTVKTSLARRAADRAVIHE